jgi:hypothetical protein
MSRGAARAEIVKQYLTESHCDGPGKGCLLAALGSDAGRQGRAIRRAFREGLGSLVDILAKLAPGRSSARKRKQLLADMAQMVGRWCWRGQSTTERSRNPRCGNFRSNAKGALILGNRWVST